MSDKEKAKLLDGIDVAQLTVELDKKKNKRNNNSDTKQYFPGFSLLTYCSDEISELKDQIEKQKLLSVQLQYQVNHLEKLVGELKRNFIFSPSTQISLDEVDKMKKK